MERLVVRLNKQSIESSELVAQMIPPTLHQSIQLHLYHLLAGMNSKRELEEKWKEVRDREEEAYCLENAGTQHLLKEVIDHSVRVEHELNVLKLSLTKVQWDEETQGAGRHCPKNMRLAHMLKMYIEDSRVEFDSGLNEIFFRTVILEESLRLILQKTYKAIEEIGENWLKDYTLCPPSRFNSALSSELRHTNFFRVEEQESGTNLRARLKPQRRSRPLGRIDPDYRMEPRKVKKVGRVERLFGCCF